MIELLAAIGIVAVLAALLIGGVGSIREASERAKCANNLRIIGVAAHTYAADNNGWLPPGDRDNIGNFGRLLSEYTQPMKTPTMSADLFYCPANVRLGSPPAQGYLPSKAKGWSGYYFGYIINASIFPITGSDPTNPKYIPDEEARVRLAAVNFPTKTVAMMDLKTRAPGVSGPPSAGFTKASYFDPKHRDFNIGLVHGGRGNFLFVDNHVETFSGDAPVPVMSLPSQTKTWWP